MTYTLAAVDVERREVHVAVASRWPGVGGVVPYFRAGVGLVCTQHHADGRIATGVLDALAAGRSPQPAVLAALEGWEPERRQIIAVAVSGGQFVWSGVRVTEHTGEATAPGAACAGNTLADPGVARATLDAYLAAHRSPTCARLIAALRAGDAAGGDRRGREGAAIRVWPLDAPDDDPLPRDFRVDNDPDPLAALERIVARRAEEDPGFDDRN